MTKLSDGVAVVTGAGSGLGRALAIELCSRGQAVVGLGRREAALEQTGALAGETFVAIPADVSNPQAVRDAFDSIERPVTVLINNAGVYPHRDFLAETTESFMDTVNINLGGMVTCTRAALADMGQSGVGRIVNVSSFADIAPSPCSAAYSVSKGACSVFSRALVADLGDRLPGIVVSTWMPGVLNTDMGLPDGLEPATAAKWGASLALNADRSMNGTVWEMDREILPPKGLKGRVKDTLLMRKRPARRL
ncbi:short-subunit dehydrogenase [Shimia isoporae]|uniref:Short-subunit dehydrogenase n=1 Tax=Shimia isoporae TaxID=647720 RepID=A0A4V2Q234_9RHOB|nr:SDR family oxidoreductase [Shimia isoporae]TCL00734.1 short-subunit dehydrogenase [Shimia isoporae]